MSEALLIAIIGFATRFGIAATLEFLRNRGASIDDAINALTKAESKTLDDYIRIDAEGRNKPST